MGANEDELERIRTQGPFGAPELSALRNSLAALGFTMKEIAGSPGWEGLSASAASANIEELSRQYFELEALIGSVENEVVNANRVRTAALADYDALPDAKAPSWVHDTLDVFDFPGIPQPVDLAQGGLALIENFLGDQREQAAGRILAAYQSALGDPTARTNALRDSLGDYTTSVDPNSPIGPEPGDDTTTDTTTGTWTGGGAYRGTGYTGVEFLDVDGHPPYRPPTIDDVEVGVDDTSTGVLPGGGAGGGGSLGAGGSGGVSGLPGAAGIGAGSAIAGAGALAAARLGGGAAGMARGGVRVGTGGLLGAGAPGGMVAPGAQGSTAARGTAAGGSRGGSGLLGASGVNGAAGRDDRKRTGGRGLGGPIAPKIDDEDDVILPGSGARAGGRNETASADLDG